VAGRWRGGRRGRSGRRGAAPPGCNSQQTTAPPRNLGYVSISEVLTCTREGPDAALCHVKHLGRAAETMRKARPSRARESRSGGCARAGALGTMYKARKRHRATEPTGREHPPHAYVPNGEPGRAVSFVLQGGTISSRRQRAPRTGGRSVNARAAITNVNAAPGQPAAAVLARRISSAGIVSCSLAPRPVSISPRSS
jgi:hypothetical protein